MVPAGAGALTAKQLLDHADPERFGYQWDGLFLTDGRGKLPTARSLGKQLAAHDGRWHGGQFRQRRAIDSHTRIHTWWLEEWASDENSGESQEVTPQTLHTPQDQ